MKNLKRLFKITGGLLVTAVGIILMPVPGPGGTPVTLAGLAILASELPAANRLKEKLLALRNKYYTGLPPGKRRVMLACALTGYAVMTTGAWILFSAAKS